MPARAVVEVAADAYLTTLWGVVQGRATAYRTRKGYDLQLPQTHNTIPAHLTADAVARAVAPDNLGRAVSARHTDWATEIGAANVPAAPCAVEVHNYTGPQGNGIALLAYFTFDGALYYAARQRGPETYRNVVWKLLG